MCDGMRLDRRLVLLGAILVVLSMTMATQYATLRASYSFAIVHPSEADIRYIGSDNSSADSYRVLRVNVNDSGTQYVTIELGSWMPNSRKNYTAAFGIVNEEEFSVNITHINVSGTNASYLDIWLHGNRTEDYDGDGPTSVLVVNDGVALYDSTTVAWTLAAGNSDPNNMNTGGAAITTPWDDFSHVRYCIDDTNAVNETDDYVWVGIGLDIPSDSALATPTGTIYIHLKASTIT